MRKKKTIAILYESDVILKESYAILKESDASHLEYIGIAQEFNANL